MFKDYQSLFSIEYLDLILEFTGDEVILCDILNRNGPPWAFWIARLPCCCLHMALLYTQVDRREAELTLATSFASSFLEGSPEGILVIDKDYIEQVVLDSGK